MATRPSGAAARLGLPRSTLESKIRPLEINKDRFRSAGRQIILESFFVPDFVIAEISSRPRLPDPVRSGPSEWPGNRVRGDRWGGEDSSLRAPGRLCSR